MKLPDNYYHCFLGNGLDAVLIGYTGSMVADKVSVDRCAWYKSDRYYPEDKLVKVAGRFPMDKPLEHAEGSGWYEIAPLGRTWYEVLSNGHQLDLVDSKQRFVPQEGILIQTLTLVPFTHRLSPSCMPGDHCWWNTTSLTILLTLPVSWLLVCGWKKAGTPTPFIQFTWMASMPLEPMTWAKPMAGFF